MSDRKMTARLFRPLPKIAMAACVASMTLAGCDTVLPSFVGKSKAVQDQEKAQAIPPATPPSTASFVHQDRLTDYASGNILPPTLPMDDVDQGAGEDTSAPRDFHKPIAVAPLSSDNKALEPLAAAAARAAALPNARFVLLVLSPPATDAAAMDRNNEAARLAATAATKLLGDNGVAADKVEVSMATNPSVGTGELRLYQR